jgi:hypothetical protein
VAMPSAFRQHPVEPSRGCRDAPDVRPLRPLAVLLFAGCAIESPDATPPPPQVPVAVRWPSPTTFRATLAAATPDEPVLRAAGVWWREALRQTVAHELRDDPNDRTLPVLELTIDGAAGGLAACLVHGGREQLLTGERFEPGGLAAAIDRLAWATRLAVGEAVEAPIAIAAGTSADWRVLNAVDDAAVLLRDGGFRVANRILVEARSRDGASPFVLDGLATLALLRGEPIAAERLAREALGYQARLLPTTQHRLARTLLLARASLPGADAPSFDRDLLRLAELTCRERPHDPQPMLSAAIAHDFLGDFEKGRALLTDLRTRMPEQPIVAYHLGWACLGGGDAAAALGPFDDAAARLPVSWVLLPRAIALFEAGEHDRLRELLQALRDDPENDGLALQLLRMQAAHALLRGDVATTRQRLIETLTWLGKHPHVTGQRAGEVAEQGALLVRLGGANELPSLLAAIQQQHEGSGFADVCSFLSALATVHRTHERQPVVEQRLGQGGDNPWSTLLAAYAHELRGEMADMQVALERSARMASSPMTKTLLARGLTATGKTAEAERLMTTLRAEMRTLRLREACRHPLLGPELAFAFFGSGP